MHALGAALVIGSGGGLGAALVQQLKHNPAYGLVLSLGRKTQPALDYGNEALLAESATWVAAQCAQAQTPLRLLVVASGYLHGEHGQPERSWAALNAAYLQHIFLVNAIGPAMVVKHFLPLLDAQEQAVAAFISARVGSVADNRLGGWYGYRASKAALNQMVKTASIELARRNPQAVCVALHPGTLDTALSRPFAKAGLTVRTAEQAATELLAVMGQLVPADTGRFIDHKGESVPW